MKRRRLTSSVGPTSYVITYTQIEDVEYPPGQYTLTEGTYIRVDDYPDVQCTPQEISYPNRYLTFVTQFTSVAAGQTAALPGDTFSTTLIGPTALSSTLTYDLYGDEYDAFEADQDPNGRCHLNCGQCFITFPLVRVSMILDKAVVPTTKY